MYLQVVLQNTLHNDMEMLQYSISECPGLKNIKRVNPDSSMVCWAFISPFWKKITQVLHPSEQASLFFQMEYADEIPDKEFPSSLEVLCKLPHVTTGIPFLKEVHTFSWTLNLFTPKVCHFFLWFLLFLKIKSKETCIIETLHPERDFLGSYIPYEFTVSLLSHTAATSEEFKVDSISTSESQN